jgi:hypothetical protein
VSSNFSMKAVTLVLRLRGEKRGETVLFNGVADVAELDIAFFGISDEGVYARFGEDALEVLVDAEEGVLDGVILESLGGEDSDALAKLVDGDGTLSLKLEENMLVPGCRHRRL